MNKGPILLAISVVAFSLGCAGPKPQSMISDRAPCEIEALAEQGGSQPGAAPTTFCVHQVTAMTPIPPGNNCAPAAVGYAVGDSLCINCKNGSCRATTTFAADDGVWLRACQVDTSRTNGSCQQLWPRGTCKSYVTVP